MATYQASVGLNLKYATAYSMASATAIDGVTGTPAKGGTPDDITVNIISENFVRHLNGQSDMGQMTYEFVPDFTASTGNVAVIGGIIESEKWFYEEYVKGSGNDLGAGVLFKGKVTSLSIGEQSGNSAQTAQFFVQITGDSIYICSGGATPTYTDLFTGAAVTTPV